MLVRIDPDSPAPLHAQISAAVRRGIAAGEIAPGERLPGARDLAASLGVNLHTVLRGYQELRAEGLVELRRGRGAQVRPDAAPAVAALRQAVHALVEEARRLGLSATEVTELVREAMA
ncbi:GntR family transcriptional regulator [Modestobacter marinus]|uniref:GntR family transcriptional regulator n=1 Tax=Modestobacter marinus TaxID=477641 RepID=A0A846LKM4_9ACTN|nr:GntR family transcriptional regulator [Modestobacter marinus]NIH68156.1 GntR family transcriptional regulator [Modestobacter marinus]GGL79905.1 GntR family transcriptional regulator [Modestobacter marinus]